MRCGATLTAVIYLTVARAASADAQGGSRKVDVVPSVDGVTIAYEVAGQGTPALVFVHGWSCDRSYWAGQLEAFSRDFTVVAPDLGGHGESGLGRKEWTIKSFGGDVATVVERLDLKQVILIGHSMGGDVIADAARLLPGRVKGLIWVDVYKQLQTARTPEQVQAFVDHLRPDFVDSTRALVRSLFRPGADTAMVERVALDMSSAPPEVALSALESSFNHSREITRDLQELKLPLIAINPDSPPTDVASMKRYGIEVMLMPGVDHFMMMEDVPRFNGLLRQAIDRIMEKQQEPH